MKDDLQLQQADLPMFEGIIANNTSCISSVIRPRDQDDHHDDAHPEGENNAKRQKIYLSMELMFLENLHLDKLT
ncbi:hypothetical protein Tco_0555275, partial [Tanacetum coccineum]